MKRGIFCEGFNALDLGLEKGAPVEKGGRDPNMALYKGRKD